MLLDSAPSRMPGVRLGLLTRCGGARQGAPMIEHARNMPNAIRCRCLCATQNQIVILRSLKSLAKGTDLVNERAPKHAQMAKRIVRQHQRRIPCAFEIGIEALPVFV